MASSSSSTEAVPPWVELPPEITAAILHKLGTVEILMTAQKVCTTWRRVCQNPATWRLIHIPKRADINIECDVFNDLLLYKRSSQLSSLQLRVCQDPATWPRIHFPKSANLKISLDLDRICRSAVDLSQGHLTDIIIECNVSDDLLLYISQRSSQLSRLQLRLSDDITGGGLKLAVKSLPLLEELHLYLHYVSIDEIDVENVGLSCPLLKSFKLNGTFHGHNFDYDSEALAIARSMPQLHQLQLVGNAMTDKGLKAILDCCPHLESLDLRKCMNVQIAGDLERLCSERIKDLRLPNDPMDDYPYPEDFEDYWDEDDNYCEMNASDAIGWDPSD